MEPEFDISRLDKHDREHLLLFATLDYAARDKTFQIYSGIVDRLKEYGLVTVDLPRAHGLTSITIISPDGPRVVTLTQDGRMAAKKLGEESK